jgi:hypothetical protein
VRSPRSTCGIFGIMDDGMPIRCSYLVLPYLHSSPGYLGVRNLLGTAKIPLYLGRPTGKTGSIQRQTSKQIGRESWEKACPFVGENFSGQRRHHSKCFLEHDVNDDVSNMYSACPVTSVHIPSPWHHQFDLLVGGDCNTYGRTPPGLGGITSGRSRSV